MELFGLGPVNETEDVVLPGVPIGGAEGIPFGFAQGKLTPYLPD